MFKIKFKIMGFQTNVYKPFINYHNVIKIARKSSENGTRTLAYASGIQV